MFKNLNATMAASAPPAFVLKPRQSALERSKSMTLALLGISALTFVIGSALLYLMYSEISGAESKVVNLQAQAGSSAQIAKRFDTTMDSFTDTTNKLSFLEQSVPQNQYVPTLLQQLQTLAITTHLTVTTVKPGPLASLLPKPVSAPAPPATGSAPPAGTAPVAAIAKATPPPYDTLPIDVTVSGTYRQVMSFIYGLPRFPKILCLKGVTLSPGSGGNTLNKTPGLEPLLTANLKIDAYVFSPAVVANSAVTAGQSPAPGTISAAHSSVSDVEDQINAPKAADGGAPIATTPGPVKQG